MTKIHQLDATELQCPDFSYPVRHFLDELPPGDSGHIITKESRAELRLKHICGAYEWELKGPIHKDGLIHFIVLKSVIN